MLHNQTKNIQNAGFTLVEIMVVILIIGMLMLLGNFGSLTIKREKVRMEELAVGLIGLIDLEKTDALLGRTEKEAIVRKRKVIINFTDATNTIDYTTYADLAEDEENTFCSYPEKCDDTASPVVNNSNTPLSTKSWTYPTLSMAIYSCTDGTDASSVLNDTTGLAIGLQGDTMNYLDTGNQPVTTYKHIILQIKRNSIPYRDIHIDRRTGMTYERESIGDGPPSCL